MGGIGRHLIVEKTLNDSELYNFIIGQKLTERVSLSTKSVLHKCSPKKSGKLWKTHYINKFDLTADIVAKQHISKDLQHCTSCPKKTNREKFD